LLAETLRALAATIDQVAASDAVGAAQAMRALTRQLETIRLVDGDPDVADAVANNLAWLWRGPGARVA
jgi:hypothetical protein